MSRNRICAAALAVVGLFAAAAPARAALVNWDIDSAQSFIRLNIADQNISLDGFTVNVRLRDAAGNAWDDNDGKRAFLDGTVATNLVDGASIDFLGGSHNIQALNSGNFRPNPASFDPNATNAENPDGQFIGTGTAPAAFAARVNVFALIATRTAGYLALRNVFGDLESGVIPLGGGTTIAGGTTALGIASATGDLDGLFMDPILGIAIGQPIPDTAGLAISLPAGSNFNSLGGSVTDLGGLDRRLNLSINMPLSFDLDGIVLNASITGQIVAFTTLVPVPEPSSVIMASFAALGLCWAGRRRFRRG